MFCQSPLLIHFELELASAGGRVAVGHCGSAYISVYIPMFSSGHIPLAGYARPLETKILFLMDPYWQSPVQIPAKRHLPEIVDSQKIG